jgi:hypothetical protein
MKGVLHVASKSDRRRRKLASFTCAARRLFMYTKLEISQFRAFKSVAITPLGRINLIAGDNNIGKTGVLEAIYLAHANDFDRLGIFPSLFRRTQQDGYERSQDVTDNFWLWLFHKRDLMQELHVSLSDGERSRSVTGRLCEGEPGRTSPLRAGTLPSSALLELAHSEGGRAPTLGWYRLKEGFHPYAGGSPAAQSAVTAISTRFEAPASDAELVNTLAVNNELDELLGYLSVVEPRLAKLDYLRLQGHKFPYVYADIGFGRGKQLIPATQLGHGFARLLRLFATLMVNKPSIVLIDEFEDGLQHDALTPIWRSLGQFARNRDIQIFATTHSYECIQAAHEAAAECPEYDLSVVRLQPSRVNEVEAVVLDREKIETALDAHLELR